MQLNPGLVTLLGFVVFGLGWLIKWRKLSPTGSPMLWLIVVISLAFGGAQVILAGQIMPFPALPGGPPSGPADIVFVWLPMALQWVTSAVAWVVTVSAAVFAAAQGFYGLIIKGIVPELKARFSKS